MDEIGLTYLASPYSDKDPEVKEARFQAVCEYAAKLMRGGTSIFCPIAMCHPIANYGLPGDWQFWKKLDELYLGLCDTMVVLKLDGWEQSEGVQAEIEIMKRLNKPILYIDPDE